MSKIYWEVKKYISRLLEVSYKFDSIKILGINYSKTYAII